MAPGRFASRSTVAVSCVEPRCAARRRTRAGFTLAELIVALSLLAVLATVLFGALAAHVRLARMLAQRVLEADAVRTAGTVLGGELRRVSPVDLRAVGPDSIALRAFRGIATFCGTSGDGTVVHFRGDRAPDPTKDSLLWIRSGSPPVPAVLARVTATTVADCRGAAPGAVQLWHTTPSVDRPGVLLLFESGTYHLADRALRYRIGAGGRQPLTAELFIHPPTGFGWRGEAALEYRLAIGSMAKFPVVAAAYFAQHD